MDFSATLLTWYDGNRRTLPWRGSRNPYLIWISEIIFQQTRIEQGTGYYLRFVDRFPTLKSLADAGEDEVLRLWQGLGYYSRARNLLFTARFIRDNQGGIFPVKYSDILKLKGVGDYTASCIASICYGEPQAAVDGNVFRVLSRVYADNQPIDTSAGKSRFKNRAQGLISIERPGDFNEALMDLGAMVCKPRNPDCHLCPLSSVCLAFRQNRPTSFPVKSPSLKKRETVINFLYVVENEKIMLHKRAGKGIWKGLYEFPMIEGDPETMDLASEYSEKYGLNVDELMEVRRVRQQLTHASLDIRFYTADCQKCQPAENPLVAIEPQSLNEYPFPKPIADFLNEPDVR